MEFVIFQRKKGINLLFRSRTHDVTPFLLALCKYEKIDEVMKVIEDTIISNSSENEKWICIHDDDDNNEYDKNNV